MAKGGHRRLGMTGGFIVATGAVALVATVLGVSGAANARGTAEDVEHLRTDGVNVLEAVLVVDAEHMRSGLNMISLQTSTAETSTREQMQLFVEEKQRSDQRVAEELA